MTDKSAQSAEQASPQVTKVPGRTLGFSIMVIMIAFVAYWMNYQSQTGMTEMVADSSSASYPGFRSDLAYLPDDAMLGFVEIPAGVFTMGSNPALDRMAYENERWSNLQRQGEVRLPTFYIARYETTVAQFRAFVRDTGVGMAAISDVADGTYPVASVTWPEAIAYGRWLQDRLLASEATPVAIRELLENGGRVILPSEAEWEKAARGSDGRVFPWGARPRSDFAHFASDAPLPVGSKECPDCAHGLADMAGNVWELTRSPLQDYPYDPSDDLQVGTADPLYVMRGGSYADAVNNVRTAVRGAADPGVRNATIGFRLVITPQ